MLKYFNAIVIFWLVTIISGTSTYAQSANYVDSLLSIAAQNKQDDAHLKALVLLGIYYNRKDPAKAKPYLHEAIRLATLTKNVDRECGAHSMLLAIFQEEGSIDSAEWCVSKLRSVAERAPEHKRVQTNYNQAMALYYKKKGDLTASLPHALAAVKLAEQSSVNKTELGGQWLNVGNIYASMGDYKNGMVAHFKALGYFEAAGNKLGESFCYNSIAKNYMRLNQLPNAMEYSKKSLAIKKELNDKRGVCVSELMMGEIFRSMGNLPKAMEQFKLTLKIATEEQMIEEMADCYYNMGLVYKTQGQDSMAILEFKKIKSLTARLQNKELEADADAEIALLSKKATNKQVTENVLEESMASIQETGNKENEASNYKRMSDYYTSVKQYDKALVYLTKFHELKDSLDGFNAQVQLTKMDKEYSNYKKEQQIVLLTKDKQIQSQTLSRQKIIMIGSLALAVLALCGIWLLINRSKLKQRMKELELRNQIAADLHDEVGSSLSSIHMLSQMANKESSNQKNIMDKVSANAQETMERMSDIVWMIKPGETEAGSLKQRMERFTYEISSSKNIDLQMQLDDIEQLKLNMDQRKNIYLIFKEAVNNAAKYSGTNKMEITATVLNNQLHLAIKDFGTGFNVEEVKKGNGIDNMQHRASLLNGSIDINAGQTGTSIFLSMPV